MAAGRQLRAPADSQQSFGSYVRDVAGGGAASELGKAAAWHSSGSISDDECAALTSKILG